MKCPRCQQESPADADFCPECGTKLVAVCASCGTSNAPTHKFCKKCGQRLGSESGPVQSPGRFPSPESYTPRHLAEKIITSKTEDDRYTAWPRRPLRRRRVDTAKSFEVYREWLAMARPAPGPGGLRRPLWLPRAYKPDPSTYRMEA